MSRTLQAVYDDLQKLADLDPDSILIGIWDYELIIGHSVLAPGKGMVSLDEVFKTNPCVTFQDIPLQVDFKRPWALPEPIFADETGRLPLECPATSQK